MSSYINHWESAGYPPVLVDLLTVLARSRKGGKAQRWLKRQARSAVARGLESLGHAVAIQRPRKLATGRYEAHRGAAVVSRQGMAALSVDFCNAKPERRAIERLAASPGIKVLVLVNAGPYRPWQDRRSPWHRVEPKELEAIDYLIGARTEVLQPQPIEEVQRGFAETNIDPIPVLKMIGEAWQKGYPLSTHGKAYEFGGPRHLPRMLLAQGFHPKAITQLVKRLKADGLTVKRKAKGHLMRGLKLTEKAEALIKD